MKRSSVLIAAVAVLATACGPTTSLKLTLRSNEVDVKRVVSPAIQLVPPAPVSPVVSLPPIPQVTTPPPIEPPVSTPVPPTADPCPKAGPFDVPAMPASQLVAAPPVNATSLQMSAGSFAGASGTPSSGTLAGVVQMTTERLPSTTSSVGQQIDSWRVIRRGPAPGVSSVEVYRLLHPSSSPAATQAGIYLVGLQWKDPVRGDVNFTASGNGLEIMSIPAQPSTNDIQYIGADTDASTLTTLELTRNVRQHKRVDACGKLIDTITVEMTGTLTTPDFQRQVVWNQQVATSYGAVDVEDTLTLTSVDAGYTWTRSLRNTTVPAVPKEAK